MRRLFTSLMLAAGLIGAAAPAAAAPNAPASDSRSEAREPSAAQKALVRRYFAAIKMEETLGDMMDTIMPAMMEAEARRLGQLNANERRALVDSATEGVRAILPDMMESFVTYFASHFSEAELQQIVAFYESPVGMALTERSQLKDADSEEIFRALIPKLTIEITRRFCQKVTCDASGRPRGT
ncbi:MAG: DUF2059 domain-containing protein [Caulobacteraceae bacterium]